MWQLGAILLLVCLAEIGHAQSGEKVYVVADPKTFPLWEHGAPGAKGDTSEDIPSITVYLPVSPTHSGTAVVVAPGGSYTMLASNHEGRQVANWFNAMGVTAFVLKYRLGPRYHHPIELGDAQRAIRWVRAHADEYGYKSDRVGIMGFSAGGHLASTAGTKFDEGHADSRDPIERLSCRPDFMILAYPVISMSAPYTHQESATNLLGENASEGLRRELSSELHVSANTPPTFLFSTTTDTLVPPENTVAFYSALLKAGVPAEVHVFEKGPHGVGLEIGDPLLGEWPMLLRNWLRDRGLLAR
jgi:acetyl esterase/lipase